MSFWEATPENDEAMCFYCGDPCVFNVTIMTMEIQDPLANPETKWMPVCMSCRYTLYDGTDPDHEEMIEKMALWTSPTEIPDFLPEDENA